MPHSYRIDTVIGSRELLPWADPYILQLHQRNVSHPQPDATKSSSRSASDGHSDAMSRPRLEAPPPLFEPTPDFDLARRTFDLEEHPEREDDGSADRP